MTVRPLLLTFSLVWTMSALPAQAQNASTLTLSEPTFDNETPSEHVWQYQVGLKVVPEDTETTFMLYLRVPERTRVHDIAGDSVTLTSQRLDPFTEVTITTSSSQTVTLRVTGRADDVKAGPVAEHQWRVNNGNRQNLNASAPEVLYNPSFMRFVFGAGLSHRLDDPIDFKVDKDTLFVVNDSKLRVSGTVGALFKVREFTWSEEVHPLDILVSLEFTQNTDRVLDGVMFGFAIGLNKYLSVGVGYARQLGKELSPGFRRDSKALVDDLLHDDDHKTYYDRFRDLKVDDKLYDGFSILDPETGKALFPGSPSSRATTVACSSGCSFRWTSRTCSHRVR